MLEYARSIVLILSFARKELHIHFHPFYWRKPFFALTREFGNIEKRDGNFQLFFGPFFIWTFSSTDDFTLFGVEVNINRDAKYKPEKWWKK